MNNRRSIRLQEYNYSLAGVYFITLCTKNRETLFGKIIDGKLDLNEFGKIVSNGWYDLPNHYENVELDEFVVMPNHFHGIINFTDTVRSIGKDPDVDTIPVVGAIPVGAIPVGAIPVGAIHESPQPEPPKKMTIKQRRNMGLSKIIGRLKMVSAKQINILRDTPGVPVWQRNYYEHIVRNENSLNRIREYIIHNPMNWEKDKNWIKQ